MVQDNLAFVRQNITDAAVQSGRNPRDITLVCVTKEATIEQAKQAIECGVCDIGENRVQDALEKHKEIASLPSVARKDGVRWHLIGHLQTNKVKKAVEIFDLIHSVDSIRLALSISEEAAKINKVQDILVQVNTSGEESKFGIAPEETITIIKQIILLKNIRVLGLMTIAPFFDEPEKTRPCFRKLRVLLDAINASLRDVETQNFASLHEMIVSQLSMGMSNDYQVAIEEGATMVRIGSAIFK